MPFNLLLIPLVAGYLFLTSAHLFAYSTSLLQKEQLLLRVSIVGLFLAVISRVMCCAAAQTSIGAQIARITAGLAPFPFIGTALGTLFLSCFAWQFVNLLVPINIAGDWLYHSGRLNQLESLLLRSAMGVAPAKSFSKIKLIAIQHSRMLNHIRKAIRGVAWNRPRRLVLRAMCEIRRTRRRSIFPFGDPVPVMLTMTDNKVYVGYISALPPVNGDDLQFVRLLPLWSGYRQSDTKEVIKFTSYIDALRHRRDETTLLKVLRCAEISSASLFEEDLFDIPEKKTRKRKKPELTRKRLSRPLKGKRSPQGR